MRWRELILYFLLVCLAGGLVWAAWWLVMIWLLTPIAELLALLATLAVVG